MSSWRHRVGGPDGRRAKGRSGGRGVVAASELRARRGGDMPTHSSSISAASIPGSISARDGDATKLRLALAGSPSVTWCQSRYDSASASSSGSEGATAGVDMSHNCGLRRPRRDGSSSRSTHHAVRCTTRQSDPPLVVRVVHNKLSPRIAPERERFDMRYVGYYTSPQITRLSNDTPSLPSSTAPCARSTCPGAYAAVALSRYVT
jgi:hypothetical protein